MYDEAIIYAIRTRFMVNTLKQDLSFVDLYIPGLLNSLKEGSGSDIWFTARAEDFFYDLVINVLPIWFMIRIGKRESWISSASSRVNSSVIG
jgi:hypothetical protein